MLICDEFQAPKDENLALGEGSDKVESPHRVGDEDPAWGVDTMNVVRSHLDLIFG